MRTVRFQAEIATNAGYDSEHNDVQGIGLDELGRLLQTAQQKAEAICGIYVPVILSGPNRTCYPEFCGCPSGGEISYTLYSLADYRQKLAERNFSETQWKRAVIILVNELKIMHEAVCATCGKPAMVPFIPRDDRPVYCSECFAKMKEEA